VAPVALEFDVSPPVTLYVQTYRTSNTARQDGDTCIDIWDESGRLVQADFTYYETYGPFVPGRKGTYWIRIYPYSTFFGEYALWLGTGLRAEPAPGTFANAGVAGTPGADGVRGGLTTTKSEDSQLIRINDRVIYGDMTPENRASGDWYRFVVE
jgi:hypothetical protein